MNYFVILFLNLILFSSSISKDFVLICEKINTSEQSNYSAKEFFKKRINFEHKTLLNISGKQFDKIMLFGRSEIIIENKIFNTVSTYNIEKRLWTIYGKNSVLNFKCFIE